MIFFKIVKITIKEPKLITPEFSEILDILEQKMDTFYCKFVGYCWWHTFAMVSYCTVIVM